MKWVEMENILTGYLATSSTKDCMWAGCIHLYHTEKRGNTCCFCKHEDLEVSACKKQFYKP